MLLQLLTASYGTTRALKAGAGLVVAARAQQAGKLPQITIWMGRVND